MMCPKCQHKTSNVLTRRLTRTRWLTACVICRWHVLYTATALRGVWRRVGARYA